MKKYKFMLDNPFRRIRDILDGKSGNMFQVYEWADEKDEGTGIVIPGLIICKKK